MTTHINRNGTAKTLVITRAFGQTRVPVSVLGPGESGKCMVKILSHSGVRMPCGQLVSFGEVALVQPYQLED